MIVFRSLVFNALFLVYHLTLVLALTSLLPFPRRWSQSIPGSPTGKGPNVEGPIRRDRHVGQRAPRGL